MTPTAQHPAPEWIGQTAICRKLGICVQTWRNWRRWGWVPPPIDHPGRPRWLLSDIESLKVGRLVERKGRRSFFGSAVRRRRS